jgi:hypothetical protein
MEKNARLYYNLVKYKYNIVKMDTILDFSFPEVIRDPLEKDPSQSIL